MADCFDTVLSVEGKERRVNRRERRVNRRERWEERMKEGVERRGGRRKEGKTG